MKVRLENHYSLWLARPLDDEAREHLEANSDGQWMGGALAVEPRYVAQFTAALEDNGVEVEATQL